MSASSDTRPRVVVVTGPTSAGKTRLALELASRFDGEILNADSMQIYRYMDIGTAKPSAQQRSRKPHHLLDVVPPDVAYSAGRFARESRAAAAAIQARGHLVLLTGGTGLYIRAFLHGLLEAGEADSGLREQLERDAAEAQAAGRPHALHERLTDLDPEAAETIHPNDAQRVIRALEIGARGEGAASKLRRLHGFGDRPYTVLHLALDPGVEELDRRIDAHCGQMIDAGLLQEVRALRERGYGPELRPMQAIGYRHLNPVADGSQTLEMALPAMQRDTRRFARRQRTWLRKVPEAVWVDPADTDAIYRRVEAFVSG